MTKKEKQQFRKNVEALQIAYIPAIIGIFRGNLSKSESPAEAYRTGVNKILNIGRKEENKEIVKASLTTLDQAEFEARIEKSKNKTDKEFIKKHLQDDSYWVYDKYVDIVIDSRRAFINSGFLEQKDFMVPGDSDSAGTDALAKRNWDGQTREEERAMYAQWEKQNYIPHIPV